MDVELRPARYDDRVVAELCAEQQAEVRTRYGQGEDVPQVIKPGIAFLVACRDGQVLGCAGLQQLSPGVGELKRMYVRPGHRGMGLSRLLLAGVERLAWRQGLRTIQLETGIRQHEAVGLYTTSGYTPIPLFGPYCGSRVSLCFAKDLTHAALERFRQRW